MCYPVDDNITINCSTLMVVGNPQPTLTANITGSGIDSSMLSADVAVFTSNSNHVATVKCIADNGIEPAAIVTGYVNFGSEQYYACTQIQL